MVNQNMLPTYGGEIRFVTACFVATALEVIKNLEQIRDVFTIIPETDQITEIASSLTPISELPSNKSTKKKTVKSFRVFADTRCIAHFLFQDSKVEKEASYLEDFDPYSRSWHGSQYGSR